MNMITWVNKNVTYHKNTMLQTATSEL